MGFSVIKKYFKIKRDQLLGVILFYPDAPSFCLHVEPSLTASAAWCRIRGSFRKLKWTETEGRSGILCDGTALGSA